MPSAIRIPVVLALLLLAAPGALGTTWHVATTGDDAWPGTPAQPFLTIGRGAAAAADGDTILIADGTYAGPGNRDIELTMASLTIRSASGNPDSCIVNGEWDTDGTGWIFLSLGVPSAAYPMDVLTRELLLDLLSRDEPLDEPSLALLNDALARNLVVEGLTFTCGTAGGIQAPEDEPGGLLTVRDCVFDSLGTAVVGDFYSRVDSCLFRACDVGLSITRGDDPGGDIEGSTFENCDIGTDGNKFGSPIDFLDCEFRNNRIGARWVSFGTVFFERCSFFDNDYGVLGGYIHRFDSCELAGNTLAAIAGVSGIDAIGTIIHDNPGAGIVSEGGYEVRSSIVNSTIVRNATGFTEIYDNEYVLSTISNTIIAFNTGEGLSDFNATYTNCLVFANGPDLEPDSWVPWVDGNLELDPLFCDPEAWDYHVGGLSPCSDDEGNPVIGALGVGCDDVVAVADVELLARWTDGGVEVAWSAPPQAYPRGAELARLEVATGRRTVLDAWAAGAFPADGRRLDTGARPWASYRYVLQGAGAAPSEATVEKRAEVPGASRLARIYPNPSNPQATIEYVLARDGRATLTIYDLAGRRVFRENLGVAAAGPGAFRWDGTSDDGRRVAAGSYLVRLDAGTTSDTSRLVIVK